MGINYNYMYIPYRIGINYNYIYHRMGINEIL